MIPLWLRDHLRTRHCSIRTETAYVDWVRRLILFHGKPHLAGTGMRLMEVLRLRVKDVEFARCEMVVREGKGNKDRVTMR